MSAYVNFNIMLFTIIWWPWKYDEKSSFVHFLYVPGYLYSMHNILCTVFANVRGTKAKQNNCKESTKKCYREIPLQIKYTSKDGDKTGAKSLDYRAILILKLLPIFNLKIYLSSSFESIIVQLLYHCIYKPEVCWVIIILLIT